MINKLGAMLSRRAFAGICIRAAAVGRVFDPVSQVQGAQSISRSAGSPAIDQNPIRRRGTGFRELDPARASAGLTLFSPMDGDGIVYLISLEGKVVHSWKMPYPPGLYGSRLERQGALGGPSLQSPS